MADALEASIAQRISEAQRPVVFSGAGLSAESGVPTFRGGSEHALWSQYDPHQLASVEGFEHQPDVVLAWYEWRRGILADAQPNAAHHALARFKDALLVTQNVDDLLEQAGASADRVLHLHGSIVHDRCHGGCGWSERVDLNEPTASRDCPSCGEPVRPAVVWFGEPLPEVVWEQALAACSEADLLLVIGTSGVVQPAAMLVELASQAGAFVVNLNPEPTQLDSIADVSVHRPAAEVLPELISD